MDKERSRRVRWLLLLLLLLLLVVVVDMPDELTVKPDVPCVPCVLQRELSRPSRTTHYCQWKRKPNEISELFLTVVSPVVRHTRDSRAHRTSNYLSQRWLQRRQLEPFAFTRTITVTTKAATMMWTPITIMARRQQQQQQQLTLVALVLPAMAMLVTLFLQRDSDGLEFSYSYDRILQLGMLPLSPPPTPPLSPCVSRRGQNFQTEAYRVGRRHHVGRLCRRAGLVGRR